MDYDKTSLTLRTKDLEDLKGLSVGDKITLEIEGTVKEVAAPEKHKFDGKKEVWPGRVEVKVSKVSRLNEEDASMKDLSRMMEDD